MEATSSSTEFLATDGITVDTLVANITAEPSHSMASKRNRLLVLLPHQLLSD